MEICELEVADFIQYRPAAVFGTSQIVVIRVLRDKNWFQCYKPIIQEFLQVLNYYQTNSEALSMLKEEYKPAMVLFNSMPLYASLWEKTQEMYFLDSVYT